MAQSRSFVLPGLKIGIGLALVWIVMATTIDRVFAKKAPALALSWNPGSAEGNIWFADTLLQDDKSKGISPAIIQHAMRSYGRQPINPGAARLFGMAALAKGDTRKAALLGAEAEAMSRRDLPTQLWLIETSVSRGDVGSALLHYNRALKASANSQPLLFPVLTTAASNPAIWRPLSVMLARRPQWWHAFVEQFIPRTQSSDALYAIARQTGIARSADDRTLLQSTESRLVELGAFEQAADLYSRSHRNEVARGTLLHDGGFEDPGDGSPFDWSLVDGSDLAGVRQPSPLPSGGSALFLDAVNGQSGDVATQLVLIRPGTYIANAVVGGVSGDPLAYPRLIVRCVAAKQELLNASFPPAPYTGLRWHTTFTIPAGCPAQQVAIRASSAFGPASSTPWIDALSFRSKEG